MNESTSKSRTGKELSENERYVIEVELADGSSISRIAKILRRHRRTIEREIKKGLVEQITYSDHKYWTKMIYKADAAQRIHRQRVSRRGTQLKIGSDMSFANTFECLILDNSWSPAAALGYMKNNDLATTMLCTKTLYSYIKAGVFSITMADLPRKGAQRKKRHQHYRHAHRNIRATSIEERSEKINERSIFGHWEGDLVVGPRKSHGVLLTLVERKSRHLILRKLPDRSSASVVAAIDSLERSFKTSFVDIFKSITFDNGSEFSDYEGIEKSYWKTRGKRTKTYFAHPYCSGERGTNENTNGMIRRKIPKGKNIGPVNDTDINKIEDWVNSYPRKIHGYLGAKDVFKEEIKEAEIELPSRNIYSVA